MISVCNKQDLNSLLAKSVESDGELLMTMLEKMGISQEDPVKLSIQGDNGEILGSCQFTIPEKSPIIDDNQLTIDMKNTIKTCLNSWEKKYGFLRKLTQTGPFKNEKIKKKVKLVLEVSGIKAIITVDWKCPCSPNNKKCCLN